MRIPPCHEIRPDSSACNAGESGLISLQGRSLIVFLEVQQEPGYILELWLEWPVKTRVCSATSGLLSSCGGHLSILLEAWQGNRYASQAVVGDPDILSSCHRDIGIPINFQEESGIVSF